MHAFEEKLAESWDPVRWSDLTVVVAVSGGADSVALLRSLVAVACGSQAGLVVAHFNHRWRGHASDQDQQFVQQLSQRLDLRCELAAADEAEHDPAGESQARDQRYQFLSTVGGMVGARYVATAHTADDQAETILHRILRGTGLAGLAGIPRTRPLTPQLTLMRPLLAARRSEVLGYLQSLGQDYCRDATNLQRKYTRNRIRHELLPQLADNYNPHITAALLRLGSLAGEAHSVLRPLASELYERCLAGRGPQGVTFELNSLAASPHYLIREMLIHTWQELDWPLRDMSFEKWDQLASFALVEHAADEQKFTLPGCVHAERRGSILRLWRESE